MALPPRAPCPSSSSPPELSPVSWWHQAAIAAAISDAHIQAVLTCSWPEGRWRSAAANVRAAPAGRTGQTEASPPCPTITCGQITRPESGGSDLFEQPARRYTARKGATGRRDGLDWRPPKGPRRPPGPGPPRALPARSSPRLSSTPVQDDVEGPATDSTPGLDPRARPRGDPDTFCRCGHLDHLSGHRDASLARRWRGGVRVQAAGRSWSQTAELTAGHEAPDGQFGSAVALSPKAAWPWSESPSPQAP